MPPLDNKVSANLRFLLKSYLPSKSIISENNALLASLNTVYCSIYYLNTHYMEIFWKFFSHPLESGDLSPRHGSADARIARIDNHPLTLNMSTNPRENAGL